MSPYVTFAQLEHAGRLGNQLFQIASTLGLARKHGMQPRFPPGWSYRPYFSVPDEFFEPVIGPSVDACSLVTYMDPRTVTYLQDLSLFAPVADEVRQIFKPSKRAMDSMGSVRRPGREALIVHVRRGDNVTQPDHFPMPSKRYYLDAIASHPWRNVEIFSDDFKWCCDVLLPAAEERTVGGNIHVHKGIPRPKEHEPNYMTTPLLDWLDLLLMADAGPSSPFAISNSTFSWWGAWLAGSQQVIYPKPWYGRLLDIRHEGYVDASLMFPRDWKETDAS